jgi:DNA-binding NarL/FixJ family response regulator
MIMRKRWSEDEIKSLRQAIESGKDYAEASQMLGRSVSSIQQHTKKLGLRLRYPDGQLRVAHWSDAEKQVLRDGLAQGLNHTQIARKLGRSRSTVAKYASRARIRPTQSPPKQCAIDPAFRLAAYLPWTPNREPNRESWR